ncbi:PLD nuclease N-terminal domain-containing protein [Psychrobacillus lasiicapitis]|uniref:PLDc_N domain-containing protein n=1 Tax=Psychrobacillus lasiicapitis TaxID=1636719 RepID=A0A544T6D5_9BACI|nr:PLD nuclease N-terminal domain-containing protein [Psychrobacillus lasiicapitis]TQR13016.1 PLDc_N domain-containing protein [Psychrobacillus lasiicapitis]GGA35150.1 negative regulatory protein YxlE [Psychrobacillus lasiicapitis]
MDLESIPWMLILPFIIIQLILMLVAIIDLTRVSSTNGPKWLWALVIILGNLIGPIIYFIVGRRNE